MITSRPATGAEPGGPFTGGVEVAGRDVCEQVLALLYDRAASGAFTSLSELASAAGAEPADVLQAVEELHERGHELEMRPAEGLRLVRLGPLDGGLIERGLHTRRIGRSLACKATLGRRSGSRVCVRMCSWNART